MKKCGKGHEYRGDENYRARSGLCPACFREVQARYERSEKARARQGRYDRSEKGKARNASYRTSDKRADVLERYRQSPKGWLNALHSRRTLALKRLKQRKEAEDS